MKKYAEKINKGSNESFEEYCHRIASLKDELDLTWTKVANLINEETGSDFSSDKYRKQEKKYLKEALGLTDEKEEKEEKDKKQEDKSIFFDKESISVNYEKGETTSQKELQLTKDQLCDPDKLLSAHGFDPAKWTIKTANNTKSLRQSPNGEFNYYSSRILVKPKEGILSELEEIKKHFDNYIPRHPLIGRKPKVHDSWLKPEDVKRQYMVLPLYDFHWGRMPEANENFESFSVQEEKERIINHVKRYIEKFGAKRFETVYLIIGQDFFNSSFTGFTSSQSHLQSNAINFQTMFKSGCELLIDIISLFADELETENVKVIGSLGNHSTAEEFAMFQLLDAYFRNDMAIEIDSSGAPRKYLDLGNSCVGLGHADKEGKRIYGLMQIEAKDIWAKTRTHVFITGHLHHFNVTSEQGVEVYRCPSICYHDTWTVNNGYTQNEPKTMCFIFDYDEGLTETHFMYL